MLKKSLLIIALCLIPLHTSKADTTGNILSNSTFDDGSLTGWTTNNSGQYHDGIGNECSGGSIDYDSSGCGTSGSVAFVHNGYIEQTVSLQEDGGLTKQEINQGFESNVSVDAWFWSGTNDSVIVRQTLVDDNGNVTVQTRTITGSTDTVYTNQYATYTDKIIVSSNTQEDYDITVRVTGTDGGGISGGHNAPDLDNVTLDVTYQQYVPVTIEEEFKIKDVDIKWEDVIDDFDTKFIIEDYEVSSAFEDESFEEVVTEDFTEFEVAETMEEPTYEEELEEPDSIMEEPSGETFDEEPEPKTEEVQDEDTMDESGETMEEEPANEGSASEVAKNEDEEMEEGESDSEDTEDTEVQTAEGSSEKKVSSTEAKAKLSEDVGGTSVNLKTVEKQLSTLDKLLIQPELDDYKEVAFYESKDIYLDSNLELFENQLDLGAYSVSIYTNVSLSDYTLNDPMEIFNNRVEFLARQKLSIMIELKKLKEN